MILLHFIFLNVFIFRQIMLACEFWTVPIKWLQNPILNYFGRNIMANFLSWWKEIQCKLEYIYDLCYPLFFSQLQTYLQSHIPTARHFDLDLALYPGRTERFALYEPEVFQQYAQLLGLCRDDEIVLYSRGPFGGMLFAARSFWLFKVSFLLLIMFV